MAISETDIKLLWGRAAGICSNPACRDDLTVVLADKQNYNVGEMAHVIARNESGPRGKTGGGPDKYDNLILLCPTCHTHIDKAPNEYPEDLLKRWKTEHEQEVRSIGAKLKFETAADLKSYITRLLAENASIFKTYGPHSEIAKDPGSNAHQIWTFRKLDTMLPNNRKIMNAVEANAALASPEQYAAFLDFKNHATGFERNQYNRLDSYPLFPTKFEEVFRA
jgi:hypothetical protein